MQRKVGVVVSMCGKNELTKQCVDSILVNAGTECVTVVVDDGSKIPYKDKRVHVIRYDTPHGNTHSMNAGIVFFENKYKYIVNLDNDVILAPNALKYLAEAMDANPILALAGSARLMKIEGVMRLLGQGVDMIGRAEEVDMKSGDTNMCGWVSGCSVMLRSSVIQEIGMYDKRFKNYCQDFEWCLRAILNDYRNAIVHSSRVFHHGSGTLTKDDNTLLEDRDILLKIISCRRMQEVFEGLPLDRALNKYGRLTFDTLDKSPTAKL